jgi:hypothetical protein
MHTLVMNTGSFLLSNIIGSSLFIKIAIAFMMLQKPAFFVKAPRCLIKNGAEKGVRLTLKMPPA